MDDSLYTDLKHSWQIMREGTVNFSTDDVHNFVDSHIVEIFSKLKETYTKGYVTSVDDYLNIDNPYTKEVIKILVEFHNHIYTGTENLEYLAVANLENTTVKFNASHLLKKYGKNLKEILTSTLIHEISHFIDPGVKKKTDPESDYDSQVNSDMEALAFNKEYIDRISRMSSGKKAIILNKIRKGKPFNIPDIDDYMSSLTQHYKRKFIKELVKEILK